MKVQWQPDLATGHREIDNHHRELFQKIDELITACKERREKPAVIALLAFLTTYVQDHFVVEESYLNQHGGCSAAEHHRQHEELRRKLGELTTACAQEGVTLAVVANSLKLTYLWLKDHIQTMDREMTVGRGSCQL